MQYDYSNKLKSGFQKKNSDVQLISGAFQYKGHGFTLTSSVINFLDFRRVPIAVSKLIQNGTGVYEGLYNQVFNVDRMSVNQISYLEIGGIYSNAFCHFDHDLQAIRGSVKYLIGINGAAIKLDELEFNIVNPSLTRIFKYKGSVNYASGFESGMGLDIGFMYKKTLSNVTYYNPFARNSACEPYDYKFKFDFSIVDFGYVKFTKEATFLEIDAGLSEAELNDDEFALQNFGIFVKKSVCKCGGGE